MINSLNLKPSDLFEVSALGLVHALVIRADWLEVVHPAAFPLRFPLQACAFGPDVALRTLVLLSGCDQRVLQSLERFVACVALVPQEWDAVRHFHCFCHKGRNAVLIAQERLQIECQPSLGFVWGP